MTGQREADGDNSLLSVVQHACLGRVIRWSEVGYSLDGYIETPLGEMNVVVYRQCSSGPVVVVDNGCINRLGREDTSCLLGWQCRGGIWFVECEVDQLVNALRDLVQVFEEEVVALHEVVPPIVSRAAISLARV